MTTTINWKILQLDCNPQEDGYTDVVVTAHWQCIGTSTEGKQFIDGDGNISVVPFTAQAYGAINFTLEQGAGFTPYASLTQEQVLDWCYANGVNKNATELSVQQQIDQQINPPVVTLPLPWAGA